MLREIASGVDGRPLPGYEAQQRAREALTSAGYRWPGYKPEAPKSRPRMGVSRATRASVIIEEFERRYSMKICLRCERILPLEAFHAKAEGRSARWKKSKARPEIALRKSSGGSVRRALLVAWLPVHNAGLQ